MRIYADIEKGIDSSLLFRLVSDPVVKFSSSLSSLTTPQTLAFIVLLPLIDSEYLTAIQHSMVFLIEQ